MKDDQHKVIWFIVTTIVCCLTFIYMDEAPASSYSRVAVMLVPAIPMLYGYILFSTEKEVLQMRDQPVIFIAIAVVGAFIGMMYGGLLLMVFGFVLWLFRLI